MNYYPDVQVDEGFRADYRLENRDIIRHLEERITRLERELSVLRSAYAELSEERET